jgi:molybdopterin-containing oxidoreductase family membrane subunit
MLSTTEAQAQEQNMSRSKIPFIVILPVSAILALIGIGAWLYQVTVGMQVTGLNNYVVWGIYVAVFFTAMGGAATLFMLVGISEFKPLISRATRVKAVVAAIALSIAGGFMILADIGNPIELWRLPISALFTSTMVIDFWMFVLEFIVAIVYLVLLLKGRSSKVLGVLAMLIAVSMVTSEALLLTGMPAHAMWLSGLTIVLFWVSALVAGSAVALMMQRDNCALLRLFKVSLCLLILAIAAEVLATAINGTPQAKAETMLFLTGHFAPYFWVQIMIGLVLPLILVFKTKMQGRGYALTAVAAALALAGVILGKLWELGAGQTMHWLGVVSPYTPQPVECLMVVGAIGMAVLIYFLFMKFVKLPLEAE